MSGNTKVMEDPYDVRGRAQEAEEDSYFNERLNRSHQH